MKKQEVCEEIREFDLYEFDNDLNSLPSEYRIFCNELGKIDKLKLKLSRFRRSSIEVKLNKMVNSSDLNFLTISSKLESLKSHYLHSLNHRKICF